MPSLSPDPFPISSLLVVPCPPRRPTDPCVVAAPAPTQAGSTMARHWSEYRDYFSSSAVPSFPASATAAAADMDLLSQAPLGSQHSLSDRRVHMENLDLNSQGEGFPFLDQYSGYLQREKGHGEQGLPRLGPSGDGGRFAAFQPPRPINTGAGSNRRRSQATRGRHSRDVNNGAGSSPQPAGSGPQVHAAILRIGSPPLISATGLGGGGRERTSARMNASPAEDVGVQDGVEDEDDNGSQLSSSSPAAASLAYVFLNQPSLTESTTLLTASSDASSSSTSSCAEVSATAAAAAVMARDESAVRQSGQVELERSQVSMQAAWNAWPQSGSRRRRSSPSNSQRQTTQSNCLFLLAAAAAAAPASKSRYGNACSTSTAA
ncbi:hypothetical protein ABZP36_001086 [Zizania latifolia]